MIEGQDGKINFDVKVDVNANSNVEATANAEVKLSEIKLE